MSFIQNNMMMPSSPNNPPVQPPQALEEFDDSGYNRFDSSFMYYKNSPLLKLSPNFPLPGSQAASWISPPQLLGMPSTSEYKGERKSFMNMPGYYTSGPVKDPALPTRSLPVDVITEILLKLPVRDILRFRCVCKLWHSLTQDHLFISRHLHERPFPNDLGIITLSCQPSVHELSVLYSVNGFHRFDMISLFRDEFYDMSNSCNGLVCVYGSQTTYVVNPSIREVLALPKTKYEAQASVALGQDTSTGEYKVVRLFYLSDSQTRCEIFNLGSHSWRDVQGVPSALSSSYIRFDINPIFVNGAIHWLTGDDYEIGVVVVAFDIKEENFHVIKLPLEIDMYDTVLVDWDGHLCLSVTPRPEVIRTLYYKRHWVSPDYKDIWVLEDYGNHRWKRHRISMQLIEDPNVASKANPLVVRDGRVLWQSGSEFHFYDLKSGRFMRPSLHVVHGYVCAQACAYKDTFISPVAIQAENFGKRITGQGCP